MYPDSAALGPASPTIREAHEAAVELITGSPVSFSEGTGRRVTTKRTERSWSGAVEKKPGRIT